MVASKKTRREQQFESARRIAVANDEAFIDPGILFGRASNDDLDIYTPEMLALSAVRAAADLKAWDGETPRITIAAADDVTPNGVPVSILSIVDHNKAFLYDSVMGEVTSLYRDITMAIHPILSLAPGGEISLSVPEQEPEGAIRVSYMQIHLAPLSAEQARALEENLADVLAKVKMAFSDWKPMLSLLDAAM